MTQALKRSREFEALSQPYYLAHCAISPISTAVKGAMTQAMDNFVANGVADYGNVAAQRFDTKNIAAKLFGGQAHDYAFVPNASFGINQIARSIDWRKEDSILLFEQEFPTNIRPWLEVARDHGLGIHWISVRPTCSNGVIDLEYFEDCLRQGTRLVAMSAVQFQSGARLPIEEIRELCTRYGTLLFVDAIQACGVVPFDGSDIDFWVTGGHKWLLGPEGTGLLYVNPRVLNHLNPNFVGWLSLNDPLDFLFSPKGYLNYERPLSDTASRFELGTHNTIGLAGFKEALILLSEVDIAQAYRNVQRFHDVMEPTLTALGFQSQRSPVEQGRSGILSFVGPPGICLQDLVTFCSQHRIVLTAPDGHLRIAPHFWNPIEQVAYVEARIQQFLNCQR